MKVNNSMFNVEEVVRESCFQYSLQCEQTSGIEGLNSEPTFLSLAHVINAKYK
jgi:hypothetical protein